MSNLVSALQKIATILALFRQKQIGKSNFTKVLVVLELWGPAITCSIQPPFI